MRTNRKNVLIGLGLIIAIGGAVIGSGAFSTVQADRGVSVQTAGDADAYLAITPGDGYDNSAYITNDSDTGTLTFDLGQNGPTTNDGTGFNQNATTTLDGMVNLTNQGENAVEVGVGDSSSGMGSSTTVELENAEVTFEMSDGNTVSLNPGKSATINVTVDTTGSYSGDPSANVTIYAEESP